MVEPRPLRELARPTTFIESQRLTRVLGTSVVLASETFQHTGSFKFRAAYNVAANVKEPFVLTASSGNFGQALAYACTLVGKSSIIVMPETSARVKVDAVREYGGHVDLVDVSVKSRAERVAEIAREHPEAYVASAYDDPLVIAGNASLGEELSRFTPLFDDVVAPVGGGGLTSGIVTGLRSAGADSPEPIGRGGSPELNATGVGPRRPEGDGAPRHERHVAVVGAEPLLGNDAARSLRAGHIVKNESEPKTMADGARTVSLGERNWAILREGLAGIVEVPEEAIAEAVRILFLYANLKVEPTGALSVGALLTAPDRFRGRRVCCVVSGGNVDPGVYRDIIGAIV